MNGYSNGYPGYGSDPSDPYAYSNNTNVNGYGHTGPSPRSLRPGGYGDLSSPEPSSRSPYGDTLRAPDNARRRAPRERQRSVWLQEGPGEARAAQEIEKALQYIKRDWAFMTEDKCVPVQVALQLLDSSSLGLANRAKDFKTAKIQLQNALRAVVNEHHQGFNSSIGTFHQIQTSIDASQQRVQELKLDLIKAKANFSSAKPEYQSLAASSRNYAEMLDLLHVIEQVQQVPERLEASISDKRFLSSVDMLQDALKLIRRPDMEDIAALSDTKVYLSNQEHSLTDILTEELHNHLYLKSPYCEERWTRYAEMSNVVDGTGALSTSAPRELFDFLEELDTSTPMTEDASRNPEANSFHYIQVIVESLNKLGRLSEAVDSIEERLPVELFKVVERSNNEVQQRHPNAMRDGWKMETPALDQLSLDNNQSAILKDLLDTLYAKFEAIAEAHRVFHDVVGGIAKREEKYGSSPLTRGFKELWKLYQSEMRSLFHDYLSAAGSAGQRLQASNEGNIFRQQRDRTRKVNFKMDLVDIQAADLQPSREEVVTVWQKFVPGLVSLSQVDATATTMLTTGRSEASAAGHKLLVEPSVFNISCLLPQSVTFLNRLKEIVPPSTDIVISTLSSFLNDFLINVFHPQLEDTITDFCSQSFVQLDAFQQDTLWTQHSQKPVFRGTIKFLEIVTSFCKMLDDLTHDQSFTQLLITQMNTYYDKCSGWYKALITRSQAEGSGRQTKAAASLAETKEMVEIVDKLRQHTSGGTDDLNSKETSTLVKIMKTRQLVESDLILDAKSQSQLCLLYTSMKWLSQKLGQLRRISDRATESHHRRDSNMNPVKRNLANNLMERSTDGTEPVYIPLSSESAAIFDSIIGGYGELAEMALRTLHLEMRCQILFRLGSTLRGSFMYAEIADAPDEDILALSNELLKFDQEIKSYLQPREHHFIKNGISRFVDAVLISSVTTNVKSMNPAGNDHFQLNTRVLYHNLLNIEAEADLPRAFAFCRCFDGGPDAILSAATNIGYGFTKDELKVLLELKASESLEDKDRDKAIAAKKTLDDHLAQLNKLAR